jgi:hypothetical protein
MADMRLLIILPTPVDSRSKSDLQAPGVMQLMITVCKVDSGSGVTREASSRTAKTCMSFETAYLVQRVLLD